MLLIPPGGVEPSLQEPESCVISITLWRPNYYSIRNFIKKSSLILDKYLQAY